MSMSMMSTPESATSCITQSEPSQKYMTPCHLPVHTRSGARPAMLTRPSVQPESCLVQPEPS